MKYFVQWIRNRGMLDLFVILPFLVLLRQAQAQNVEVTHCFSMQKVFLNGERGNFVGSSVWPAAIGLARNEHEGFQIVVSPKAGNLTDVRIEISDFLDSKGHVLSKDNISIAPVGYVHITSPSKGLTDSYKGWWPDPILSFLSSISIPSGKHQPFFVSVFAPSKQPSGIYRGKLTVRSNNAVVARVPVKITVWDFTLPSKPSLPTVLGLYESCIRDIYKGIQDFDLNLKRKYFNFLLDYKISPDNLYVGIREVNLLDEIKSNRWLGPACLGMAPRIWEDDYDTALQNFLAKTQTRYQVFQQYHLLDNAYIYAFDEVPQTYQTQMLQVFHQIKQHFPDIPILTTSVGLKDFAVYPDVDEYVVMYDRDFSYKTPTIIDSVRAAGKKVYWYTSNHPPLLNFDIENPLLPIRILMGAATAKYRPDGYLYWAISRWTIAPSTNSHPIESGPLTDWDPQSLSGYNGCGSWFYPGRTGPLSSLRLETFRDGMEDYEYFVLLDKALQANPSANTDLITRAQNVLSDSPQFTPDMLPEHFLKYPEVFYKKRQEIAAILMEFNGENPLPSGDFDPPSKPTGVRVVPN